MCSRPPSVIGMNELSRRGAADVGVAPKKVHLKWISRDHPWAKPDQWKLSTKATAALEAAGVRVECLPNEARFAENTETETSAGATPSFTCSAVERKRRLLITSANWSVSAWGAGTATA